MVALLIIVMVIEALAILILAIKTRTPKYDGNMVVMETDEKKIFSLEVKTDPNEMAKQKYIVLKVTTAPE